MTTATTAPTTTGRTALLLAAAVAVAGAANTAISVVAVAAGAQAFAPLTPPVYLAFTVLGVLAGYLGWRLVRARAQRPARVLRILVPVIVVASLLPNVALAATAFIPGTTLTGVIALSLMHLVVAAVAVPVYQRIAPVR